MNENLNIIVKENPNDKGWFLIQSDCTFDKDKAELLMKELIQNQKLRELIDHEIQRMELAEVDVQNWLSEEGHQFHVGHLAELKRLLEESKK